MTNSREWNTRQHLIPLPDNYQYKAKMHDTCHFCKDPIFPGDYAQKVTVDAPV